MARLRQYPGFATVSSDYFQQHAEPGNRHPARPGPDLRRLGDADPDAAAQRLFAELSLPDQETRGPVPGDPRSQGLRALQARRTCRCCTSSRTTERTSCRSTRWSPGRQSLGPQTVNHLNQFTSVTIFFNLKPDVAIGDATDFISKAEAEIVPPTVRGEPAGRSADVPRHGARLDDPDGARRVRHVRDPGDSVRELRAPADRALHASDGAGRRIADACTYSASRRRSTRSSACSC